MNNNFFIVVICLQFQLDSFVIWYDTHNYCSTVCLDMTVNLIDLWQAAAWNQLILVAESTRCNMAVLLNLLNFCWIVSHNTDKALKLPFYKNPLWWPSEMFVLPYRAKTLSLAPVCPNKLPFKISISYSVGPCCPFLGQNHPFFFAMVFLLQDFKPLTIIVNHYCKHYYQPCVASE